jgi:hypothetical protein
MKAIVGTPELTNVYLKAAADSHVPALVLERRDNSQLPELALLVDREIQMHPGVESAKWLDWYKEALAPLPPGVYQLTVHLGFDDDELRAATNDHPDWGAAWRQNDYNLVRSPEFQKFLKDQHFILVSWKDLASALSKQ